MQGAGKADGHYGLRAAAGKTHAELLALEAGITERLDAGEAGDPEYWAAVLRRLTLHKAKARLRELHARLLERHLQRVVLAGDGVDVAQAMGWEAERQARQSLALTCILLVRAGFSRGYHASYPSGWCSARLGVVRAMHEQPGLGFVPRVHALLCNMRGRCQAGFAMYPQSAAALT